MLRSRKIIAFTDIEKERIDLETALHCAEEILDSINESIRDQENQRRLEMLSKDLWIGNG